MIREDSVPFMNLRAEYASLQHEIDDALQRVLDRADFILGEDVALFEHEFARYCETAHCIGVASGTDALKLALQACGVEPGDEVITSAHTFIATVLAIMDCGATPVLVDCDAVYYTIDVEQTEAAITPRTKAIVPVHLYGQPAAMQRIVALARAHGIAVVEDACQAHGATYDGLRCGSLGDAAAFSFYPAKNLGAYGDGGAVVTRSADVAERVRMLRDYGQRGKYNHVIRGCNSRLDTLQAAILRVKLAHLDDCNRARQRAAAEYTYRLGNSGIIAPEVAPGATHVFHLYVVRTDKREELRHALTTAGISFGVHYPTPPHLQPALASLGYSAGRFPVSERLAGQVLSLPMHPQLTLREIERVCSVCRSA